MLVEAETMVCYSGLKPYEREGMRLLAEERLRAGLPLHLVVPGSMGGAQPVPRSIDTVAREAESGCGNVPTALQPAPQVYEGRGTERTGEHKPYFIS